MSIFDSLKRTAESTLKKEAAKAVNNAVQSVGKGKNRSESFIFATLPTNVTELQSLPEASLDSAFKTTALTIIALCRYEQSPDEAIEMLNFLKGPAEVSTYEKQFIRERLTGKIYKARSFFAGATPQNGYTPTLPYTITVSETLYSFDEDNWATLYDDLIMNHAKRVVNITYPTKEELSLIILDDFIKRKNQYKILEGHRFGGAFTYASNRNSS